MRGASELIILAIIMSIVEAYCLFGCKKFGQDRNMVWYLTALLGYALIVLILARLSRAGKIGIINSVWNAISICTSMAMGFVVFKEVPSRMEIIGVVAIVIGVVMTQLP